jgi:hypothetical protein
MALVLMATHGWGTLFIDPADIEAGVGLQSSFANPSDLTAATHYADDAGASPSTGPVTADANGRLVRWIEEGAYIQTLPGGAELEVQAVSGATVASVEGIVTGNPTSLLDPFYGITTEAQKDGTTDVSARILAFLEDLDADGGAGVIPPSAYRITTPIEIGDKNNLTIDFQGGAFFQPEVAGAALTLTNVTRATIRGLRFRLLANLGSLTALLELNQSEWITIYEPEIWYHANIPDNQIDGIVFQGDSYWGEVVRPRTRVLSGGITGLLRRGVSFTTASNACKLLGGSLNSCYVGAYIKGANATEINGTAFETVSASETIGVQLDGDNISSDNNGGTRIQNLRLEAVDIGIDFAMLYQGPSFPGIYIGPMSNQMAEANEANLIRNPNNIPFQRHHENALELGGGPWDKFDTRIVAQAGDAQSAAGRPVLEFKQRPLSAPITSLTVDPGTGAMSGAGTLTVLSTAAQAITPTFPTSGLARIDDEVFSYTGKTATTLTGVTRALGGTVAAAHQIGATVEAGLTQVVAIDTTGTVTAKSSSANPPTPADDRFILHHRAFITKLISWDPTSTSCSVQQVVGDQAGGFTVVTGAFKASFRPGSDAAIDLGLIGTRWRSGYFSGQVNPGYQKLTSDANINWTPVTSPQNTTHAGTLTQDRNFVLLTTGAQAGMIARVSRSGGGAFDLLVLNNTAGATVLAMATATWAEFTYDGTNWVVFKKGAL